MEKKKVRFGVVGIGRGSTAWKYCQDADNAKIVAICDKREDGLEKIKKELNDSEINYFTDYHEFLKADMDAVVLSNYATEHAPFAIEAMLAGKNVISEVLPCQTMAEAVRLIETVEKTGKIYCYAENYCHMDAPRAMREAYRDGRLGEFEYGEGEYMHNCEPLWPSITYGERDHWRNRMSAFFYCTHSACPLLHICGLKPTKVSGFELPFNARMARMGARAGFGAVEMITLENGAVIKSLHGVGPSRNSIWYTVYGSKGRMESAREDAKADGYARVYENLDEYEGQNSTDVKSYLPEYPLSDKAKNHHHGHGGSDYFCYYEAFEKLSGNDNADIIDVYEAVDSWMCGFFGYLSVLNDGISMDIPDLRDKSARDAFRNDNRCCDPKVAKDELLPSYSYGDPLVPDEIYEKHKKTWEQNKKDGK